jgi:ADP-ribosylglycohydrolase
MNNESLTAIKNSALWAAYGDALGFITELADSRSLLWRVNAPRVAHPVPWRRVVGGKFGVEASLPAGCYSDDTQLRLATSRAIRGDGRFDVEAFAKVELPVWLSYSLGAGRGTKAAAASLRSPDVAWFSNFFVTAYASYIECGGNGASMRIQPHVWAARDKGKPEYYSLDVVRNAVCTHGHLRGILGAVFHGICLATTLKSASVAGPDAWTGAVDFLQSLVAVIRDDSDLGSIWIPVWEERSGRSFDSEIANVRDEMLRDIDVAASFITNKSDFSYCKFVEAIGGLTEEHRGSGTKTAIAASVLSWVHRTDYPASALVKAANLLGSDTDTIATMAGAILGCVSKEPPKDPILDEHYIAAEAVRAHRLSRGEIVESFRYPDLFSFHPPRTQLDAIGLVDGTLAVAGLGVAEPLGPPMDSRKKEAAVWQWLKLQFGQTIFAKRRDTPKMLSKGQLDENESTAKGSERITRPPVRSSGRPQQPNLLDANGGGRRIRDDQSSSIDQLTNEVIKSNFNEALIGKHLLSLANGPQGIERAVAYVSILVKARIARLQAAKSGKANSR